MDSHKRNLQSAETIVGADPAPELVAEKSVWVDDAAVEKVDAEKRESAVVQNVNDAFRNRVDQDPNLDEVENEPIDTAAPKLLHAKSGLGAMSEDFKDQANLVVQRLLLGVVVLVVGVLGICFINAIMMKGQELLAGFSYNQIFIPLTMFWTFCMYQLNHLLAVRYQKKAAFSNGQIVLISIVAMLCMPEFTSDHYYFGSRFWDPFFYCWLASQAAFYWGFGAFLEKQETPGTKFAWKIPLLLASCVNAFVFLMPLAPNVLNAFTWFQEQGYGLIFLFLTVLHRPPLMSKSAQAKKQAEAIEITSERVVVSFHLFAGLQEWMSQQSKRARQTDLSKAILKCFILPFLLLIAISGGPLSDALMTMVQEPVDPREAIYNSSMSQAEKSKALTALSEKEKEKYSLELAAQSVFLLDSILLGILGVSALGYMYCQNLPSHVALTNSGIGFLKRRGRKKIVLPLTPWGDITFIDIQRPARKKSPVFDVLVFCREKKPSVKIPLRAIDTVESREAILKAIQTFVPKSIGLNPRVTEALQPAADHSYTELWLQGLSEPPQRERLKPLSVDATLQEGRLSVLGSLGAGGQGQAYLATDHELKQDVVLKEFLLPVYVDITVRRSALEVFENEAKILSQLNHPQIVKLMDYFIEDHRAYLVLEHIQGSNLRQHVAADGKISEAKARELALQMCDILQYLHGLSPPVVHRDFAPDNLILQPDGLLKLIDFNVAKQSESTAMGTVVGKHAYLPPEQFRGKPVPQSDIYAMGATIYYLVTGQDPEAVSTSRPKVMVPELSDQFNQIVAKATAPDIEKRYRNVDDIRVELLAAGYINLDRPGET